MFCFCKSIHVQIRYLCAQNSKSKQTNSRAQIQTSAIALERRVNWECLQLHCFIHSERNFKKSFCFKTSRRELWNSSPASHPPEPPIAGTLKNHKPAHIPELFPTLRLSMRDKKKLYIPVWELSPVISNSAQVMTPARSHHTLIGTTLGSVLLFGFFLPSSPADSTSYSECNTQQYLLQDIHCCVTTQVVIT